MKRLTTLLLISPSILTAYIAPAAASILAVKHATLITTQNAGVGVAF